MMRLHRKKISNSSVQMKNPEKRYLWIILGVILLISMSSEFASMARQLSFWDALASFVLLTLLVLGIRYWLKKSKKT